MNIATQSLIKNAKKFKNIILRNPFAQYKKDLHLTNQPFYFEGENGKAVLLIHGWTSTPYEVRRLGLFLNEAGYTVSAPMLKGHGTFPKELENVHWKDWIDELKEEYFRLRCGIGKNFPQGGMVDYVLSDFLNDELEEKNIMLKKAVEGIEYLIQHGKTKAMTDVNSEKLWIKNNTPKKGNEKESIDSVNNNESQ